MWVVAGVLLGSVVLAALASLHVGPHGHGVAAVLGTAAAIWLILMAAVGLGRPLLFALLGADVVMSAGLGALAWKGLRDRDAGPAQHAGPHGYGIALGDLDPFGIVRVGGEEWSAESVNGRIDAGSRVHVIGREGVRVQVWGDHAGALQHPDSEAPAADPFRLDPADSLDPTTSSSEAGS